MQPKKKKATSLLVLLSYFLEDHRNQTTVFIGRCNGCLTGHLISIFCPHWFMHPCQMNPYRSRFHLLPLWCTWSPSLYQVSPNSSIYYLRPLISLPSFGNPSLKQSFSSLGMVPFTPLLTYFLISPFFFLLPCLEWSFFFSFLTSDSHPVIRLLFVLYLFYNIFFS